MAHPLDRIVVKGFKSIREMDLELTNLNVLIGANGAGKTNLINVFELLNQIMAENLQVYIVRSGGADAFLHFGQKITDSISIDLSFGRNGYTVELVPALPDTIIFEQEGFSFHGEGYTHPWKSPEIKGYRETQLFSESRKSHNVTVADQVISSLKSWQIYHFHDTSVAAKMKHSGDLHDNRSLRPDASNLAAYLYLLHETQYKYYQNIVETIRLAAPFFNDFILQPSQLNSENIQLRWREVGSTLDFNAHALSDGTLRFMCLATLLLQPELPTTILLDEPELGLHPSAINLLAEMIKSAAKRTQVIVSTQSVTLVNEFSLEDIIVVDREDNQSVFKRLKPENIEGWLDDYGVGDVWEKNIIGGRPR